MALTAFDSIRGTNPANFKDVCISMSDVCGRCTFRSAGRCDMFLSRTRILLGRRSFRVAAPLIWNGLPGDLRATTISRGKSRARLEINLLRQAYATGL